MVKITMDPIHRYGITIPGGWTAKVAEIQLAKGPEEHQYVRYLASAFHLTPAQAQQEVRRRIQAAFVKVWLDGLRQMIAKRARLYRTMYGDLEGFDPEGLQWTFFPHDNTGRAGKPYVREMLAEMRRGYESGN